MFQNRYILRANKNHVLQKLHIYHLLILPFQSYPILWTLRETYDTKQGACIHETIKDTVSSHF